LDVAVRASGQQRIQRNLTDIFPLNPFDPLRLFSKEEIAEVAARCRFDNCSHTHEPGCAVKAALRQGRLSVTRYHNYCRILETLG